MAITSQPFVLFTSFNFWLVGLDALYHCSLVGIAQTPSSRRNTATIASFRHLWRQTEAFKDLLMWHGSIGVDNLPWSGGAVACLLNCAAPLPVGGGPGGSPVGALNTMPAITETLLAGDPWELHGGGVRWFYFSPHPLSEEGARWFTCWCTENQAWKQKHCCKY